MRLSAELERERQRYDSEKTNSASDYQELQKALEDKFIRDKTNLETNFAREKLQLEQTVEELRQIFTNGERGLKGKLKDDFIRMVSEYKTLLDKQNVDYEDEMKTLREQTVKYSEENGKLKMEIVNMKEQHEEKVNEIETK
jgi:predicted  nucleic acid-binding Zn-ribbon protein